MRRPYYHVGQRSTRALMRSTSRMADQHTDTTWHPAKPRSADQIRRAFIDFFKRIPGQEHTFVPSSPAAPVDDPTLLFTNAGMNQFKPCFLGTVEKGSPLAGVKRAVNSQKCIRAGGKHNDLDDVGLDTYHHTFFEMLGNWSFGDYFKAEAIEWAWTFLTEVCGLEPDRLYATYFEGSEAEGLEPDHEARDLWLRHLPPERILPGNAKDNFWEMGDVGPCGPCSEIHYDRIGGRLASSLVNKDDPDVIEVWNLVFIQFNREKAEGGSVLKPLPAKHVDTGMGLERLTSIIQNTSSNYDTDIFQPIFAAIQLVTGYERGYTGKLGAEDPDRVDMAYRVIADHIRTLVVAIADGATPSNEGRGYVLRRVLRRAVRFGRQMLGAKTGFMTDLVPVVARTLSDGFPELTRDTARIAEIINEEETSFGRTLDKGIKLFASLAADGVVSGEDAFKLYDTFGFPLDLTEMMAQERGLKVDVEGFHRCMEQQRERSRAGSAFGSGENEIRLEPDAIARLAHLGVNPTDTAPVYDSAEIHATIKAIFNGRSFDDLADGSQLGLHKIGVVLDRTNFYAEAGGQVADHGRLIVLNEHHREGEHGRSEFRVEQVKRFGDFILHIGHIVKGSLRVNEEVECKVDRTDRHKTEANHTATHLLNFALRKTLGSGVDQKGSLVEPDRLRFDFSHSGPMTEQETELAERIVREQIAEDLGVYAAVAPLTAAKGIRGLRAVFGEKYPDPVRVVSIGTPVSELLDDPTNEAWEERSIEFCGGTHVSHTGAIGEFVLVSETGTAKGIRRVEALTGVPARAALAAAKDLGQRIEQLDTLPDAELAGAIAEINAQIDQLTLSLSDTSALRQRLDGLKERAKAAAKEAAAALRVQAVDEARFIADSESADTRAFIVGKVHAGDDRAALQAALKVVRDKRPEAAVLLASAGGERVALIAAVPGPLIERGLKAGDWVRAAAEACGGKGGGKPNQAQGGGTDIAKIDEAIRTAESFAERALA
ncbi:MAG TPA: alanine--tRNA ligase [Phycisphaerales bacterium]|nr:alanine--tRNA ligase [Phycisphaerales bacterium]